MLLTFFLLGGVLSIYHPIRGKKRESKGHWVIWYSTKIRRWVLWPKQKSINLPHLLLSLSLSLFFFFLFSIFLRIFFFKLNNTPLTLSIVSLSLPLASFFAFIFFFVYCSFLGFCLFGKILVDFFLNLMFPFLA